MFEYWGDDVGDLRFLWRFLQEGMTFLDIGAYHGVYSIVAAKKLGPTGGVVAFEPSSRERGRMLVNLKLNNIESVSIEPYAVSAGEGEALLTVVVDGFTTMNSLRRPPINHLTEQVEIRTMSLDGYLKSKRVNRVDLLKVDTEGGELEVFRGAGDLLSRLRPVIICEVLDLVTNAWGYAAAEIMALLRAHNYEWFEVLLDGNLVHHYPKKEYPEVRNYVAVPREKQSSLPVKIQS